MNKIFPLTLVAALLAAALLACLAIDAHTLQAPAQLLPGLLLANFMPAVAFERKGAGDSDTDPVEAIKTMLTDQGDAWARFKNSNEERLDALEDAVKGIQIKAGRPNLFGGSDLGGDITDAQKKSLDLGARALIAGDQARAERHFVEAKAMQAGNDPSGGYLVLPQMSDAITKVMLETSPLFASVRVVDLQATDEFEELIDKDDVGVNWVGEMDFRTETETPDLGKFIVPLHEVYAMPAVSQKLIDTTSFNVMEWLNTKIGEKFGFSFGAAIIGGSGAARPTGFTAYPVASTADGARPWGSLQYLPTGTDGAFNSTTKTDVLVDTVAALKPQYRNGASWVMNRSTAAALRKLKTTDGESLWASSTTAGVPSLLLGYPVIEDDQMPSIGASSLSIAFGNFKRGYTFVRRLGTRFLVDPYSDKPKVKLYAYQRVGGAVANFEAIKLVRFSPT